MVATKDKHRAIVQRHLDPGETLQALINVNDGSAGGGASAAQATATAIRNTGRYRDEHGIAEKGLDGNFSLHELWLGLTDRRLLVFTGSWFTFTHKPKKLVTAVDRGRFTLTWRDETAMRPVRLLHFVFPDDQHIVRMGEADDESDRFVAALGAEAAPMPSDPG